MAELAAPFDMSQPAISRHLKVLEQAGLDLAQPPGDRPPQPSARREPLREATAWLARYREYWDRSHERLDELLEAMQANDAQKGAHNE